jgi:hypothetical protein
VLHLVPIWSVRYVPTQDGSSHVYNARVLAEYGDDESWRLRDVFELNRSLFPNWATHGLLAFPLRGLSPVTGERVVMSLCVALLPLSLLYLLRQVDRRSVPLGLLGFALAYNYPLQLGFTSFALGVPGFFFALGWWWRRRRAPTLGAVGGLYALALATYLCHAQPFVLLVAMLALLAAWDVLAAVLQGGEDEPLSAAALRALGIAGVLLPLAFLGADVWLTTAAGAHTRHLRPSELLDYFLAFRSIAFFRPEHVLLGRVLLVVVAVLLATTLVASVRRRSLDGSEPLLVAAAGLVALYFASPWAVGSGRWVNDRIHLFVVPVLLPFLRTDGLPLRVRRGLGALLVALVLARLGFVLHDYRALDREIDEMVTSVGAVEPHSTLRLVYPERNGPEQRTSDELGEILHVSPFLYVATYALLDSKDVAFLANYEATLPYFPVNYRAGWPEGAGVPPDHVLAWRLRPEVLAATHAELGPDYEVVSEGRHARLYRRRRALDRELWDGRDAVRFDLEPAGGDTAPGALAIEPATLWTDGRYGWIGLAEREAQDGLADDPLLGDAIGGRPGGILRFDLPNGRWRLTLHAAFRGDAGDVRVLANDEPVAVGGGPLVHELAIDDGRLTLAIGTRSPSASWRLAAVTLERAD